MKSTKFKMATIIAVGLMALQVQTEENEVEGVFGLAPVEDGAALAIWVPLGEGESIQGVRWYNNDGQLLFPEILAVAGEVEWPQMLNDAVVVGQAVNGGNSTWSEYTFPQALASESSGLYVIFRLPVGGDFSGEGAGGGAGIGYRIGIGEIRSWIALEEDKWNPVSVEYQMAVDAVMNNDKSGEILVLKRSTNQGGQVAIASNPPPTVFTITIAPNPFNPQTEIEFELPRDSRVDLSVYDIRGRHIRTLVTGRVAAGIHRAIWDGCDGDGRQQSSGVYLARLKADEVEMARRLTMIR